MQHGDLLRRQVGQMGYQLHKHLDWARWRVTTPEPLPADNPLWAAPNLLITSHLSGASQTTAYERGMQRFLKNLRHYLGGEPLEHVVDLTRGY